MNTKNATRQRKSPGHDSSPALEWAFGAIGVLLFLSAMTFLIVEGLRGNDAPGAVIIQVDEIAPMDNAFLVRFSAHNRGSQTLADLHISAQVFAGTEQIDSAQATIDFLPGQSSQHGGFYLREDPREHRLEIRAEGYQEP